MYRASMPCIEMQSSLEFIYGNWKVSCRLLRAWWLMKVTHSSRCFVSFVYLTFSTLKQPSFKGRTVALSGKKMLWFYLQMHSVQRISQLFSGRIKWLSGAADSSSHRFQLQGLAQTARLVRADCSDTGADKSVLLLSRVSQECQITT